MLLGSWTGVYWQTLVAVGTCSNRSSVLEATGSFELCSFLNRLWGFIFVKGVPRGATRAVRSQRENFVGLKFSARRGSFVTTAAEIVPT